MSQTFEDIRYEIDGPVGVITINRPHRYNAFRGRTVEELIKAFRLAWADKSVQVVIFWKHCSGVPQICRPRKNSTIASTPPGWLMAACIGA